MSCTILLIDSDRRRADAYLQPLSEAGYRVLQAGDSDQAQRLVRYEHPSLVLIDLSFEGIEGTRGADLCRELKQTESGQSTPIVLHGETPENAMQAASIEESGCAMFLDAPVPNEQLLAVCHELLGGEPADSDGGLRLDDAELQQAIDSIDAILPVANDEPDPSEGATPPANDPSPLFDLEGFADEAAGRLVQLEAPEEPAPDSAEHAHQAQEVAAESLEVESAVDALAAVKEPSIDFSEAGAQTSAAQPEPEPDNEIDARLTSVFDPDSGDAAAEMTTAPQMTAETPERTATDSEQPEFVGLESEAVIWQEAQDTPAEGAAVEQDPTGAAAVAEPIEEVAQPAATPAKRGSKLWLAAAAVVILLVGGAAILFVPGLSPFGGAGPDSSTQALNDGPDMDAPVIAGTTMTRPTPAERMDPEGSSGDAPGAPTIVEEITAEQGAGEQLAGVSVSGTDRPTEPIRVDASTGTVESGDLRPVVAAGGPAAVAEVQIPAPDEPKVTPPIEATRDPAPIEVAPPAEETAQPVVEEPPTRQPEIAPPPKPAPAVLRPPTVLERREPTYSPADLSPGQAEEVTLRVLVNERGHAVRIQIQQGNPASRLVDAAVDAALRTKYRPANRGGDPVRGWATITYRFGAQD